MKPNQNERINLKIHITLAPLKRAFTILCAIAGISQTVQAEIDAPLDPPVPEIIGTVATNCISPGLHPAMIYAYRPADKKIAFGCLGGIFATGTNTYNIIAPAHMLNKHYVTDHIYAIRTLQPDSHAIVCYLDTITDSSTNGSTYDFVIGTTSMTPKVVPPLTDSAIEIGLITLPEYPVNYKGKTVNKLRSIITGKEVQIIGRSFRATPQLLEMAAHNQLKDIGAMAEDRNSYIAVELVNQEGCSGHLFVDEYNRLYSLNSGEMEKDPYSELMRKAFFDRFHRYPKGIAMLSGVLELNPTN